MPLLPDTTGFAYKKVDKQSGSHLCVFHLIFIVLHYRQQKDFGILANHDSIFKLL